jgi:toxin FitB
VNVLDTNVLSELMRRRTSAQVAGWVGGQPELNLFTTAITEAEIFYGIELLLKGNRREGLRAAAEAMFNEELSGRVFAFDGHAARVVSKMVLQCRAVRWGGRSVTLTRR